MAASPSSSPRLPSPPPIAEDQLGPMSPNIATANEHGELARDPFEGNASRRIRPGTKAADMALGPPPVPLTDIDSPFQLTEHLKSLHNAALHRSSDTTTTPIDRPTATRLASPPEGVDKYLWLYELCRLLCKEINTMIVALFQDDPPCSALTCNEMRASEWQYLCAVHDPPKPCCAIDYCCHTLDWTNNILTSQKNFPSRMSLDGVREGGGGGSSSGQGQLRQLTNIFRRVYRIFAHAWFQHREMYWKVEQTSGLYVFFKTVCDVYSLIPEDNYTVPPEAEGLEPLEKPDEEVVKPKVLRREREGGDGDAHLRAPVGDGATTKRHRHTPSVGSESITTVLEDPEEEDEKASEDMEETVVLSSEPPEYSEPGPVVGQVVPADDPPTYDDNEHTRRHEVDVPTIAVAGEEASQAEEEIASQVDDSKQEPAAEAEPTLDVVAEEDNITKEKEAHETDESGEKEEPERVAPSSALLDTASAGSRHVLTDEAELVTSKEHTPALATTTEAGSAKEEEKDDGDDVDDEPPVPTTTTIPAEDEHIPPTKVDEAVTRDKTEPEPKSEIVNESPSNQDEQEERDQTDETEMTAVEGKAKEDVSRSVIEEKATTPLKKEKDKESRRESKIPIRSKSKDELRSAVGGVEQGVKAEEEEKS